MIICNKVLEKASPFSLQEFSARLDALGPFEDGPHIAVAVSGGRDSMALCLLAHEWAKRYGGRISALTVDHQLRPESALEARQVGIWLSSRGIMNHVLNWVGPKPASGVQAAARNARYTLMEQWCRQTGVLHLLLGHHQEDQAETVLFRLSRGSGLDGLAGMSAIRERPHCRLLRPLLDVPRARLTAYLQGCKQAWIEDPTNENPKYARTHLKELIGIEDKAGFSIENLTKLASRCAHARVALEQEAANIMARCCAIDPAGFAKLDIETLKSAPVEISLRVLSRIIRCIGGHSYGPKPGSLEQVHQLVMENKLCRRTLGGCLLSLRRHELFVFRENRNLPAPAPVTQSQSVLWDNRFRIFVGDAPAALAQPLWLAALGEDGWREIKPVLSSDTGATMPLEACWALPAMRDQDGVACVPHLDFIREDLMTAPLTTKNAVFQPPEGMGDRGFVGFMLHEQTDILSL